MSGLQAEGRVVEPEVLNRKGPESGLSQGRPSSLWYFKVYQDTTDTKDTFIFWVFCTVECLACVLTLNKGNDPNILWFDEKDI